jgi:glycogen phosphorylase
MQNIDFDWKYMPSEALPVDTGGLGNVALEQLEAARDLGVPAVVRVVGEL